MDDNRANILRESNKIISKLQLQANFFEDEIVYKIYLRSQVVHKLFENNTELDVNKLELFHLQFTATVVDLLKKIKKTNEQNVSLIYDEIQLNRELIEKLNSDAISEANFNADKQRQANKISISLRKLYQVLSEDSREYPFSSNIDAFSVLYAADFFVPVAPELMNELIQYKLEEVYTNPHATIHRKLLGQLCKYEFKIAFMHGIKAGSVNAELYKFLDIDKHFLFFPSRNLFLFCDYNKFEGVDFSSLLSKKGRIIQELTYKNSDLESRAGSIKTHIPDQIRNLLNDYQEKIGDVNFLKDMSSFDVQANILKTMLNTDSM